MSDGKPQPDYKKINGFFVPGCYSEKEWQKALDYKPRNGNLFLATYPKCGTNWAQKILLLIVKKGNPPIDAYEFSNECPYIEMAGLDTMTKPKKLQLIKTHLPFNMVPYSPQAKYIFVVRNPKDCLVSYYHHTASDLYDYAEGTFDDYFELFYEGAVDYGDYFDHVLSWYERRNDPNVLFLYFEDMKKDVESVILKMAAFMGPEYLDVARDRSVMENILKYSSLEYMRDVFNKNNDEMFKQGLDPNISLDSLPLSSGYVHVFNYLRLKEKRTWGVGIARQGQNSGWRDAFSEEQNRRMDDKIDSKLNGTEMLRYWKDNGYI